MNWALWIALGGVILSVLNWVCFALWKQAIEDDVARLQRKRDRPTVPPYRQGASDITINDYKRQRM